MQLNLNKYWKQTLLIVVTVGVSAYSTEAETIEFKAKAGACKAVVTGDSSIHAWTMESGIIGGSMVVDQNFPQSALTNAACAKPETIAYVPIRSLTSGKETMDQKMQLTMSATNYPRVEYKLIELQPVSKPGDAGPLKFNAIGLLTIVGKTITNTMPVTIEKKDGNLRVVGSTPVKLTQFQIAPPIISLPLLPDIKVYDDHKVDIDWTLTPRPPKKP
jgi:hypothetical protein